MRLAHSAGVFFLCISTLASSASPVERMGWRPALSEEQLSRPGASGVSEIVTAPLAASFDLPAPTVNEAFLKRGLAEKVKEPIAFGRSLDELNINGDIAIRASAAAIRVRVRSLDHSPCLPKFCDTESAAEVRAVLA